MLPSNADQSRRCLCDLCQSPVAIDTYLLQPPAAVLVLRAVRIFFRPRVDVRWDVVRPRRLERSKLLGRPSLLAIGPRTSEDISHPTPAPMTREAMGWDCGEPALPESVEWRLPSCGHSRPPTGRSLRLLEKRDSADRLSGRKDVRVPVPLCVPVVLT